MGRITASGVASVLGVSPFATTKAYLKRMVDEALNGPVEVNAPPLRWGVDNEGKARAIYEFLYLNDGDFHVEETGFHTDDWEDVPVGASPDGFVGPDGMVEIKCPYSLRDEVQPHFESIHNLPGYMAQVQMQLHVTGREWCDFFQWAPKGHKHERVYKDPLWWDKNIETLKDFYGAYKAALKKAGKGGPEEKVGTSARWAATVEALLMARRDRELAEARESAAKQVLEEMCNESGIAQCKGAGISMSKVTREGSVSWKGLAESLVSPEILKEKAEGFRGAPSTSWRLTETKGEVK